MHMNLCMSRGFSGECVIGGYFCGIIYVYDSNGRYHLLDDAITQRIKLSRSNSVAFSQPELIRVFIF